jgi:hypothetical protein
MKWLLGTWVAELTDHRGQEGGTGPRDPSMRVQIEEQFSWELFILLGKF